MDWRKDERRKDKLGRAESEELLRDIERTEWDVSRGLASGDWFTRFCLWAAKRAARKALKLSDYIDKIAGRE